MKTAVEWLVNEIPNIDWENSYWKNRFEQAKQMEKEQIVTTWNTAHQAGRFEGKGIAEKDWQTFETYWEENFKSE